MNVAVVKYNAGNIYSVIHALQRMGVKPVLTDDPEDLQKMDNLVSPLIKKGQSIAHVFANHSKEINCSRTTLYKYINKS
ncbi:MAG: helix-turn-helix domain-containing protein, partial [Bacteroidaceae bacterium]|nr:helix-turn-helix domain-containing protein [Bacteroidaceae bacterium]